MAENDNPPVTVTDPPGTSGAAGTGNDSTPPAGGAAADVAKAAGMSLEQINTLTGRTYKTLEDAQAGITETYKFVGGKPREVVREVIKPVVPEGVVTREEFEASNFLRDNPEHNKHRPLLEQLAKANGMTIQAVANGDPASNPVSKLYKETTAKLTLADEAANTRSALTSNPRLGVIRDSSSKALEAFEASQKARAANDPITAERFQRQAETEALSAVISAFKMEGDTIVD